MPNTLAHFGVQALGTRILVPRFDLRWLLLGPVIPDLPWIGQRILISSGLNFDLYGVRLYAMVQASLLFCIVLSAAFALLSERPRLVFAVLAGNSLVHLLLDAIEIKWANGVHLLAPFSWKLFSLRLVWPESPVILTLTGLGLVAAAWLAIKAWGSPLELRFRANRVLVAAVWFSLYLAGPALFMAAARRSDSHFVATLDAGERRAGRAVEFDRNQVVRTDSGAWVRSFAQEKIRIANPERVTSGRLSLQGHFLDSATLQVDRAYVHADAFRQIPSYVGLLLLTLVWLLPGRFPKPPAKPRS